MDDTTTSRKRNVDRRREADLWAAYRTDPSDANRNRLIETYVPILWWFAHNMANTMGGHVAPDELFSDGLLGLLPAIRSFNPSRAVGFTTYMGPRVRGAMLDGVRRRRRLPRKVYERARQLAQATDAATAELGRPPTDGELARRMRVTAKRLQWLKNSVRKPSFLPLDTVLAHRYDNQPLTISDLLASCGAGPEAPVDSADLIAFILCGLPRGLRLAMTLYYVDGLTMAEAGEALGVSESMVSVRLAKVFAHLARRFAGRRDELLDLLTTRRAS